MTKHTSNQFTKDQLTKCYSQGGLKYSNVNELQKFIKSGNHMDMPGLFADDFDDDHEFEAAK